MAPKFNPIDVQVADAPNFTMNVLEIVKKIPEGTSFEVKRLYWLTNVKNEKMSGKHAHTDEDEIFVVLQGSAELTLDDGTGEEQVMMNTGQMIWVPRLIWHGFTKLSDDSIVLALSSTLYDPDRKGYVNDKEQFIQLATNK